MRLIVLLVFVLNIFAYAGVAEKDSMALVAFYDSTDGDNWTNSWDLSQPVTSWAGITIKAERVTRISLFSNNMNGNLPQQMADLDSLEYLLLRQNTGLTEFPYQLAGLPNLYYISISQCGLDTLTSEIQNFENLELLILNNNNFTGPIPPALGQLTKLTNLNISQNDFSGAIPEDILNLSNLESFRAGGNELTDLVDFSQLPLLRDLWVESNQFSGPLPTWVSNMTLMQSLNMSSNSFEGEFPASFANLQNLTHFYMNSNDFSGTIPAEIGTMDKVVFLQLYACNFTGTIPAEIGNMQSLKFLRLYNNQLEGEIPEHIFAPANLEQIDLHGNNLAGSIPDSISTCVNVTDIKLNDNQLTGRVPDLSNLKILEEVWLYNNNLEGEIDWIDPKAENLVRFYIYDNNFEGAIPDYFTRIASLRYLNISNNNFDYIPSFKNHPTLQSVWMEGNRFTFEDILPLLDLGLSTLDYVPQDTVLKAKTYSVPENTLLTLNMKIGGKGNRYDWYKNDELLFSDDGSGILDLAEVTVYDTGSYHCHVYNDSVPELTIVTATNRVEFGTSNPDSLALVSLYAATDGANWTNNSGWLGASAIDSWYGVSKDGDSYSVDLSSNNLNGELAAGICNLINGTTLNLSGNNLSGKIPADLGRLNRMTNINLANNHFSGRLPQDIALMASLESLDISYNDLSDLPDFSSLNKSFSVFSAQGNSLTFEDLEGNVNAVETFSYAPQDSVGEGGDYTLDEGAPFSFEVCVAGNANTYQWYHNALAIEGATDSVYAVEEVTADHGGEYICMISNDLVADLILVSRPFVVSINVINSVATGKNPIPESYALKQNFPNPFNPTTRINYQLPQSGKVVIAVYDIMGRKVETLINRQEQAGYYSIDFDASRLSSGVYFYQIKSAKFTKTLKMILMK